MMMYKYLFFALLFTLTSQNTSAQLVSWSDLVEVEGLKADHRIYYGDDSLQFGDLWLPDSGHFEMISPWTDEWKTILDLFKSHR